MHIQSVPGTRITAFACGAWLALTAVASSPASAAGFPLQRTPPPGAPNIVIVLLDDVGFGAASTFGGPAATPTLDALAARGLRYNRFHTTAICSPTRASLLTGRNPHATGIGAVLNSADARPGYAGFHTKDTATIAEILRQNGYSTAAFGKWHQTPDWELSQSGPFDRWPTGEGFEKFYGFQGGETDQFEPTLYEGTTPVMRPPGKDYHLTEDLVDRSIQWLRAQQSVTPRKPFFLYFAPGATHAPIQVPSEYLARYAGKFDQGWDRIREEILARQKRLGVVPANTDLTPRAPEMPSWDSVAPADRKFASRLMEAYAAFLSHTDDQVGRLVAELEADGRFDDTLFIYIVGDNGASAEGGLEGSLSYMGKIQGLPETQAARIAGIERIGGPDAHAHYNAGWAWAMDTPFQWTKTVASHLGGTRNPLVVTWPRRIKDQGGLRSQFGHVNDIVPTILEITGIKMPVEVNGVPQKPINGTSLVYTFDDANAAERHRTQYFEVFGHRAIYHDGWMASAFHSRLPWQAVYLTRDPPFDADRWELYDLRSDHSQAHDLAAGQPAKLAELQALFMKEAAANQVLPLRGFQLGPSGLPDLAAGVKSATYHAGATGIPEKAVPHMMNRSWSLLANLDVDDGTQGVVAAIGGRSAGWSLYIDPQRRPTFTYRMFNLKTVTLAGEPLAAGTRALRVDFDYAGPGYAKGATLHLVVDGTRVASDGIPASPPSLFTIDETFNVGIDMGSPAGAYPAGAGPGFGYSAGSIGEVTIELR